MTNIRSLSKNIVACSLVGLGFAGMLRRRHRRSVTIINYHNPPLEVFARHAKLYSSKYSFVSIDDLYGCLLERDFSRLPDYPLLITFDDGHAGNYELLPVIKSYRIPAVIYVTAGLTDTNRHFWFTEAIRQNLDCEKYKTLPSAEFRTTLKKDCDYEFEREYSWPDALSSEQLKELHSAGCTIASHSYTHPILNRCEETEIEWECRESKKRLEELVQSEIRHFALPNGDYNESVLNAITKSGYLTNRTVNHYVTTPYTHHLKLGCFTVYDRAGVMEAFSQATGSYILLKKPFSYNRERN